LVLNNAVQGSFTVGLATVDGTATGGSDYTVLSSATDNVTFAGNASENQTIEINITDDSEVEYPENFIVSVGSSTNNLVNISDNATVTITDDDAASVTIADVVLDTEGSSGNPSATVRLSLNKVVSGGFTVDLSTTDGTATAGSDYTALDPATTGRVQFTDTGQFPQTQSVNIAIEPDSIVEDNETIFISMGNVSNDLVTITDNATVTIVDDDIATVTISNSSTVTEGDNATITLSVDKAVQGGFTVTLATTDGTATAGSDYTAFSSATDNLTFAGNIETKTVVIATVDDGDVENQETFVVSGSSNKSTVTVTGTPTIPINDNDVATLSWEENVTVNEGDNATINLYVDKKVGSGFSCDVYTTDVTATTTGAPSGKDYLTVARNDPTTLSFAGNIDNESQIFTVVTYDQGGNEQDEKFSVNVKTCTSDLVVFSGATDNVTIININ